MVSYLIFAGLECVGHSFAYVAHILYYKRFLDSNPERCRKKQEHYQLSHSSPSIRNLAYLFRKYEYDSLKIEHHAHGAKTSDPVINKENYCSYAKEKKFLITFFFFLAFLTEDFLKIKNVLAFATQNCAYEHF
jgi:hypothetical protein